MIEPIQLYPSYKNLAKAGITCNRHAQWFYKGKYQPQIPTQPVNPNDINTVNYIDICEEPPTTPDINFFPQFYPTHNHDDYKVTNNGVYPGGQLTYIQVDAPQPGGLKGEYYSNKDFTDLKLMRVDAQISFDWRKQSPDSSIRLTDFSVRWTGELQPKYSEKYILYVISNGSTKLWINRKLIIKSRGERNITQKFIHVNLIAGNKYDIKLEYTQSCCGGIIQLLWSSKTQIKQIIPSERLYPQSTNV